MDDLRMLADRAKQGDRDAFGQLYTHCYGDVYAFVRRRVFNHHEAEDVVQDAFLRAWQRMPTFEWVRGGFPAFIQMIARNLVVDLVKSSRVRTTIPAPNDWEVFTNAADESPLADPADAAAAADEAAGLRSAIGALTFEQSSAVELRYLDGLSIDETCEVLGVGQFVVKTRCFRATKALRRALVPS